MRVYLFGYASDDFVGRVIVTPNERTVAELGRQLVAWGLDARAAVELSQCATKAARSSSRLTPSHKQG